MTLRAQEDAARRKMIQQASRAALRAHFSGDGAGARRWLFLREALLHSAGWTGALLCVASWAVVAGLLFGPNHADILLQVYSWLVVTPFEEVLARSNEAFTSVAWSCVQFGLMLGFGLKLRAVVKPAQEAAKQQFSDSIV